MQIIANMKVCPNCTK